jgi:hypothetical protein
MGGKHKRVAKRIMMKSMAGTPLTESEYMHAISVFDSQARALRAEMDIRMDHIKKKKKELDMIYIQSRYSFKLGELVEYIHKDPEKGETLKVGRIRDFYCKVAKFDHTLDISMFVALTDPDIVERVNAVGRIRRLLVSEIKPHIEKGGVV